MGPVHGAARIALIYLAVSLLWIWSSDLLLARLASGAPIDLVLWVSIYKGWFFVSGTAALLFWLVYRDLRSLQRSQEQLEELNDELESRVMERTAALEAAKNELEAFSYTLSHDLRAPVRAVKGFNALLAQRWGDRLPPEARDLLSQVEDNATRMEDLIQDLMAFFHLASTSMESSEVDLTALAREVVDQALAAEGDRNIQITLEDLPAARGDSRLLRQVLANLLENAVKYTKKRTDARVEIGGRADAAETVYWVRDNGVGFEMEDAERVFNVFQRLHGAHEFEGSGVGLAIVSRIVERHRGRVWAESRPGEGATFYFALPAKTSPGGRPLGQQPMPASM